MDKVTVNNQVISMRKYVKQAKVHVINKLVKEVKMLKAKHGNDAQVEKYKRKSERLLSEIEIIKKISVDTVSKKALLKEADWKAVLSNKTATLEERSFALLASYKAVEAAVEVFNKKHPRLVSLLPDFINLWEQRKNAPVEKHVKSLKASELRLMKKVKRLRQKHALGHNEQLHEKNSKLKQHGGVNRFKPNCDEESFLDSVRRTGNSASDTLAISENDDCEVDQKPEFGCNVQDSAKQVTSESEQNVQSAVNAKVQKEISVVNMDDLEGQDSIAVKTMSDNEDNRASSGDHELSYSGLKKDPFFICGDESGSEAEGEDLNNKMHLVQNSPHKERTPFRQRGRKQLSSDAQSRKQFMPPSRNRRQNINAPKGFGDFHGKRSREFAGDQKQSYQKKSRQNFNDRFLERSKGGNTPASKKPFADKGSSLHPSWEAKRKLKLKETRIATFQGTKIKFDD